MSSPVAALALRGRDLHFALERALAETIAERMVSANLTKVELARRMRTSRSQLDRVLNPSYTAVQFDTLVRAAGALGLELRITMR